MKAGTRALGVAESYRDDQSTLAGAVVRASRVLDGLAFGSCTVGGTDATDGVVDIVATLDREDVQYVLTAGVALAWYNILDLDRVREAADCPVVAVTFEESAGLEPALREAFDGAALTERLSAYRALPDRHPVTVNDERVYVRAVGLDPGEARDIVRAFTPAGGRPEPLRVARQAARAADAWHRNAP
ncbi:MAG: DUF99 family protein [Halobacteriaceae archaeon]